MEDLGQQIRTIRMQRGWTLENLAEQSGLSSGFLSQVERGLSTLSIVSLSAICHALEVPIQQLFSASGPLDLQAPIVRKASEQLHIRIGASDIGYRYLTGQLPSVPIQELLIAEFPAGVSQEGSTHEGQELGYVLDGELVLHVRGDEYALAPGDSYRIAASEPHGYHASAAGGAKVLMAVTQRFIDVPTPPVSAGDVPGNASPSRGKEPSQA